VKSIRELDIRGVVQHGQILDPLQTSHKILTNVIGQFVPTFTGVAVLLYLIVRH
jgi:hypothetical protein